MPRIFDNQDLMLPNGKVARIGTHMNDKGEVSIKLRLPDDYWGVTQVWRAAKDTNYPNGKCVILIDQV